MQALPPLELGGMGGGALRVFTYSPNNKGKAQYLRKNQEIPRLYVGEEIYEARP